MRSTKSFLAFGLSLAALSATAATPDLSTCDVWQQACHFTTSNRESTYNINRVVIHKTQGGTAAGAASWFANCASGGSAHFIFDKANGYCYQSVREKDIAWHAGYSSTNSNSVGIEHSGWVANNDTSTACYNESAIETKSCVTYYAVPANRSYIIAHSEVPGCSNPGGGGVNCHTDPGKYWNWSYYMSQVTGGGGGSTFDVILDDTIYFGASANWTVGTSAADKYGSGYHFRPTAAVSDKAGWLFNPTSGGTYTCMAWWSAGTNRSANAPYILPNGTTSYKNQQVNGGSWQTLGSATISAGLNAIELSCWAPTGYVVIADAVRMKN